LNVIIVLIKFIILIIIDIGIVPYHIMSMTSILIL